jgi:hypothetical protein
MLSGISGEVKTTVAEAQTGLVALIPGLFPIVRDFMQGL